MRFSDVKIGHMYFVIFDPVRLCEFDGNHLSLALKKNNDGKTVIVMPLTSQSNGNGVNKIKLGTMGCLPISLRCKDTYAVFNQVRAVNCDRFIALKENSIVFEAKIDEDLFSKLLLLTIKDLILDIDQYQKINLLKKVYETECVDFAKDLAYKVIRIKKELTNKDIEIARLSQEIKVILNNIDYNLEQKYLDDGVGNIFDDITKNI